MEPTPIKKRCLEKSEDIETCTKQYVVRQFQLPQQYPSTREQAIKQDIMNSVSSSSTVVEKTLMLPRVKRQIPYKLQKLRILSPRGKDLGEFNIKLKTDDLLKGKTVMITKSHSRIQKPVMVGFTSVAQNTISQNSQIQDTTRTLTNNLMDIKFCSKNNFNTNKVNVSQQSTTLPVNERIESKTTKVRNEKTQLSNNDINIETPISTSERNLKQSYRTDSNQKHVVYNGTSNVNNSHLKISKTAVTEDNAITSAAKVLHKEIVESSQHLVSLRLAISSINNICKSEEHFDITASTQESVSSVENVINVQDDKVLRDAKYENAQIKLVSKKSLGNDSSTAMIDNQPPVPRVPELGQITNINHNSDTTKQLDVQNKDSSQSDSTDQWNIIKKAMDSVKDIKLRMQALKALADCGIGIERLVPISKEHKVVHDTQVQTMVFGVLDPKSFIFINKDLDSIQRINQTTLYDMPMCDRDQSLISDLQSNDSVLKSPKIDQESDFDLDSFIKQIFEENSDAVKMKETLSLTKMRCKNLIDHLEKDFESVKRYDQNGMLNIHNAVVSNNIYLVQRQLMIIEHCKESVDILTEDGMTSLELAIKYNVHSKIVELLLKAGAQPVRLSCINESALIIASKQSSPLLSILIDKISDSKLLDQVDSEGLAALHYCSMRNNLQGVKALLSAGASINLKDMRSGRTPLFHAMDNNYTAVTQTLIKAGAVTNITNYAGQTPIPIVSDKFA